MKRADMVRSGIDQLEDTEAAIETALIKVADLASGLARMRMEGNLSMVLGNEAMTSIVQTMTALGTARSTIIAAHQHLDEVKTRMGCRTIAGGTGGDKGIDTKDVVKGLDKSVEGVAARRHLRAIGDDRMVG